MARTKIATKAYRTKNSRITLPQPRRRQSSTRSRGGLFQQGRGKALPLGSVRLPTAGESLWAESIRKRGPGRRTLSGRLAWRVQGCGRSRTGSIGCIRRSAGGGACVAAHRRLTSLQLKALTPFGNVRDWTAKFSAPLWKDLWVPNAGDLQVLDQVVLFIVSGRTSSPPKRAAQRVAARSRLHLMVAYVPTLRITRLAGATPSTALSGQARLRPMPRRCSANCRSRQSTTDSCCGR